MHWGYKMNNKPKSKQFLSINFSQKEVQYVRYVVFLLRILRGFVRNECLFYSFYFGQNAHWSLVSLYLDALVSQIFQSI